MSIICEKCANLLDCECIPYGTDCDKNFKEKTKKQYCRYCSHLVTGNGTYCTAKNKEMRDSTAKSVNHCKLFEFNEMDAFFETDGYKPRSPKRSKPKETVFEQIKLVGDNDESTN